MIQAYTQGMPANGNLFPDGARMAKVHWTARQSATADCVFTEYGYR